MNQANTNSFELQQLLTVVFGRAISSEIKAEI